MNQEELLDKIKTVIPYNDAIVREEKMNDIYQFILNNNFSKKEVQSDIMNNWISTQFFHITQERYAEGLRSLKIDRPNIGKFFSKLQWNELILTNEKLLFNGKYLLPEYNNQSLSWFHFGLLAHWAMIRSGHRHIKDISQAINLKNSLGENCFHVLAKSLANTVREDYHDMYNVIAQYNVHPVSEKNNQGLSALDIAKNNFNIINDKLDKNQNDPSLLQVVQVHRDFLDKLYKLEFYENLQNTLKEKKKNPKSKI